MMENFSLKLHINSLEKLYQQADHALYESKKNGRNQYQIFQN